MQESLEKKWDLSYLYDMTQQALEAGDMDHAIELSKKGLKESELEVNLEWKSKFEEISQALTQESFDVSEKKLYEDLTKIKGVGPTHAQKLWDAGYSTIKKIAYSKPKMLSRVKGIGIENAKKFIFSAREYLGIMDEDEDLKTQQITLDINPDVEYTSEEPKLPPWFNSKYSYNRLTQSKSRPIETKSVLEETFMEGESANNPISYQESFLKENVDQEEVSNEEDNEKLESRKDEISTIEDDVFIEKEDSKNKKIPIKSVIDVPQKADIMEEEKLHDQKISPETQNIESHTKEQMDTIYDQIIKEVGFEGFYSVPTQIIQEIFLQEIDLVFFKMYSFESEQQILLISPIKIAQIEDVLLVSEDTIEYQQQIEHNFLVNSYVSHLIHAQEVISEEVTKNGNLFQYMQKFLMTTINIGQSQVKDDNALLSSRQRISVYIDPIFISVAEVKYLEKSIPFAYQRPNNIHYISASQITDLLEFLEQKHGYIGEYNGTEQIEDTCQHANQEFQRKLMHYSLIPAGFGGLTIIIALAQIPTLLLPFIGLSYTILGVYGVMLGYLFYKFKITRKDLRHQFEIPSYQKSVELDDASLEIIYRELVDDLMLQFGYECFGKTSKYKLLNQIEAQKSEKVLNTPISTSPTISIENLFEVKENDDTYHGKINEYLTK